MKFAKAFLLICSVALLAACDSDNNNRMDFQEFTKLQVLHGSPDAPPVNVIVDGGQLRGNIDYKVGTGHLGLGVQDGAYSVSVDGILPDGDVTVIGPAEINFPADTITTIVAVNNVADIEPVVISQPDVPVSANSARLFVLHGAAIAPTVDVYVTAPDADLAGSAPVGTFSFKETIGPAEVPAGNYQIRVTPAGDSGTVVYDSGTVTLGSGDDLTIVALPSTDSSAALGSPITLVAMTPIGSVEIRDIDTPTGLRVGHLSPDTPPVDVIVNEGTYLSDVPFPAVTGIVALPADTYNVAVQAAGNPGVVPIGPVDLTLEAGTWYSVLAVNYFASIEPLILTDDARPVATYAKVRVVHASPTAMDVDVYVTAPGTDITNEDPTLPSFAFKDNTGYLALSEGDYDVTVTQPGTKTAAIGPATISVSAGGVYTAIARDPLPGEAEFGLIVLEDSLADD